MPGEPLRHGEPVEVRELHVQEHDVRAQSLRRLDRPTGVLGLTDDLVEPVRLEQLPAPTTKPRVVVDDQHGHRHSCDRLTNHR